MRSQIPAMACTTKSHQSLHFVRHVLAIGSLLALGGCGSEDMAESEEVLSASAAQLGLSGLTPSDITICPRSKIFFDGKCRGMAYFDRFVTPGATLVMVQGGRFSSDVGDGIALLEMPNARTTRVRVVSTTKTTGFFSSGRKYMSDFEVLAEMTTTQFDGGNGYHEIVSTVDAPSGMAFNTVWYERVSDGGGTRYT